MAVGCNGVLEGRKGYYQQDRFQRMQSLSIPLLILCSDLKFRLLIGHL